MVLKPGLLTLFIVAFVVSVAGNVWWWPQSHPLSVERIPDLLVALAPPLSLLGIVACLIAKVLRRPKSPPPATRDALAPVVLGDVVTREGVDDLGDADNAHDVDDAHDAHGEQDAQGAVDAAASVAASPPVEPPKPQDKKPSSRATKEQTAANTHRVELRGGAAGEIAVFTAVPASMMASSCTVRCECRGQQLKATASNFFDALCVLREQLEVQGLRPLCYGASRNVYPSGMALDMGQGLSAYRMTLGQQARITELVGIFETGPEVDPVTVAEQRAFFEAWSASL